MFYTIGITIPAQTPDTTPKEDILTITKGVITQVWVRWRWGSGALCGAKILFHEFQIYPLTSTEWVPSNVYPLLIPSEYEVLDAPTTLKILSYNNDDLYEHRLWIGVNVEKIKHLGWIEKLAEFVNFSG